MAYKKNIDDYRESPSLYIMENLLKKNFKVDYHDKFIKKIGDNRHYPNLKNKSNKSINSKMIKSYDLIVILTDHDYLDYEMIKKNSKLIIDTRNVFNFSKRKHILKM